MYVHGFLQYDRKPRANRNKATALYIVVLCMFDARICRHYPVRHTTLANILHMKLLSVCRLIWRFTYLIPFCVIMMFCFQVAYGSPHYGGQRVGGSPQAAASPHLSASPQVPSPQGQTLDLSVSRLSHR